MTPSLIRMLCAEINEGATREQSRGPGGAANSAQEDQAAARKQDI